MKLLKKEGRAQMNPLKINFKKISEKAKIPTYGSKEAAGLDVSSTETVTIPPKGIAKIPVGLQLAYCSPDYWLEIRSRSSKGIKGLIILAGTVDSDYRGELGVFAYNASDKDFIIEEGERFAQFVPHLLPANPTITEVTEITSSERGEGGFGSTGRF